MEKITLKSFFICTLIALVFGFIYLKNTDVSSSVDRNVSDKMLIKNAKKQIDSIKHSSFIEDTTMELIINLADDYSKHKNIGTKLTEESIQNFEKKINLTLPESYKLFLTYFGDGGEMIYDTSILSTKKTKFIKDQYNNLPEELQTSEGTVSTNSLLALTKNKKGKGAWYWVTNDLNENNEWPLVFIDTENNTIGYSVKEFSEWLQLLVKSKSDVISAIKNREETLSGNGEVVTTSSYLK
ncbi:MAG: SMI1/KNR4 family protein [Tenacibaculum sp.]|nr:SMI1/KNR4 family protein [Tenacibaculum sp.]